MIKKLIIGVSIILIIIGISVGLNYTKKYYALKEIQHIAQQKESKTNQNNSEENLNNKPKTNAGEQEGKVTHYFSDKVDDVKQYFFNEDIHIVSIGDSLTQGVGDEEKKGGYVGVLDDLINQKNNLAKIDNFGKAGIRTDQLIKRLENKEIKHAINDADMVIITIGANDIMKVFKDNILNVTVDKFEKEEDTYKQRLTTILDDIHAQNSHAQIFLVGFYNPFKRFFTDIEELDRVVNNWNHIAEDVVAESDRARFVPIKDIFDHADDSILSEDNFHPNHYGYELMAERILENVADEGMAMYGSAKETEE